MKKTDLKKDPPKLLEVLKRFNFLLVAKLAAAIICFLGIFLVVWNLGFELLISGIYGALMLAAAAYYIISNKGFFGKLPTEEELPPTWDKATKAEFLTDLRERRQKTKWVLLILIPLIVTFLYQTLALFVLPYLIEWLGLDTIAKGIL